jgi:uncharacterized membrane protein YkvI
MPAAVFLLCTAFGMDEMLGFGYPVMGWLCAICIALPACICDHQKMRKKRAGNDVKL